MDREITVPSFCNYTDLRKKNDLPQIEVEQIKNYAKSLNEEQMRVFLAEVPYQVLMEECSRKYYSDHTTLESIRRLV